MNDSITELEKLGFVRLNQILKILSISKSHWLLGVKNGTYPKPVALSQRLKVWRAEDIKQLLITINNR